MRQRTALDGVSERHFQDDNNCKSASSELARTPIDSQVPNRGAEHISRVGEAIRPPMGLEPPHSCDVARRSPSESGDYSGHKEVDALSRQERIPNRKSFALREIGAEHRRSCEICGGNQANQLASYTVSEWPVVACNDCGFVFLGRVPDYELLNSDYSWEKTFEAEKQKRAQRLGGALDQLTRIRTTIGKLIDNAGQRRSIGSTGRILEIGCGGTTRIAPGPTPYGIEISEALARKAAPAFAARGGKVVHAPAVEGLTHFSDGFFDAVLMRSYLEHEAQPQLVLNETRRTLRTGGIVYVRVPNFGSPNRRIMGAKWCGFRFPDHVNYFTPRDLKRLAARCGFTYRRINWLSPFDDNLIAELRASH